MNQDLANSNFDRFAETVKSVFCPMTLDALPANFHGDLLDTRLDRIHLARVGSSAVTVNRSRGDIALVSGEASYLVKFQLDGEGRVRHQGHEAHLQPGDFVMCTTNEPYELKFPDQYQQAVLAIPQSLLNDMVRAPDDFLGIKMSGQSPTHGLLSQFVHSIVTRLDSLDADIIQRLEANILDLLVTSLHAQRRAEHVNGVSKAANHIDEVKRFIALNLQDYRLSVDMIAEAVGISKRYLHLLFQQEEISVSKYIQQQRLQACHRALSNPATAHLSATDIAMEFGFGDISHFHRCFKARYDITPGQLRLQASKSR